MSEQSEVIVPATPASTVQGNGPLDGVRQLALAWIGLWGVANDDLGNFYQRCVTRGAQILNAKPWTTQPEVKSPTPEAAMTQPRKPTSKVIRPMSVFNMFGAVKSYHIDLDDEGILPTKQELDTLTERVEALSREVGALVEQRKQEQ